MKELEDRVKVLQVKYKKLREEKEKLELLIEQYTIDIEAFKKKIKEKEEENNLLKENFNKEVKKLKDDHDLEIKQLKNRLINSQYKYLDSVNECMELKKENSELKEKMNL